MTLRVEPLPPITQPGTTTPADDECGFGTITTERGNLPLDELTVSARITGLVAGVELTQSYRNPFDVPMEATYIFPMPDRAAVTGMRMEAGGRTVIARLQERAAAREVYARAISAGQRASIAEEERPDVFTMRVGNILPGERVVVRLSLVQPLPYADGEAEFRFPLVVAPRYIPGAPQDGEQVGTGWAADTDAVPDASRITPPVLLPGFPSPVRLAIEVDVDPAGLPLAGVRSSLHALVTDGRRLSVQPGERADRDFVLRLAYGREAEPVAAVDVGDGTFRLTVLPALDAPAPAPRDVVLLLDRSGSMAGWKMVAARRAAARIVDTLTAADRFAVLSFDTEVEQPPALASGLVAATDRNRFRAVEHLAGVDARGGTELLDPLRQALALLHDATPAERRDRVVVLVTDGQVGNEDEILAQLTPGLSRVRVHTVGIDRAVNAGFLARLAVVGGGRCELVESEDRLDEAAEHIHHRIGTPLLQGLTITGAGIDPAETSPARMPALFPGLPLVVTGRLAEGVSQLPAITVTGRAVDGEVWSRVVGGTEIDGAGATALTAIWARARLRDLEDAYAAEPARPDELEQRIVATSLRHGVLCRFTAFVAVDERVVTEGEAPHRVTQPIEPASGWDMLARPAPGMPGGGMVLGAAVAYQTSLPPTAAPGAPMAELAAPPMEQPAPMRLFRRPASAGSGGRGRGGVAARTRQGAGMPVTGPGQGPADRAQLLTDPAQVLADELRRLEPATGAPWAVRCTLLADLGTRLTVVAGELRAAGHPEAADLIARLAVELAGCDGATPPTGDAFEALWQRCLDTLRQTSAPPRTDSHPARRTFWRRP